MIAIPPKYQGRAAVTPTEAAEILGAVHRSTVYRKVMPAVYSGAIASFRLGRRRLIILTSLLAWLEREVTQRAA
jgi:excisionase family DNA binding protein